MIVRPLEELKPFEMAARIYCKKTGVDPDALTQMRHPDLEALVEVPMWAVAAEQLIDLSTMLTSLHEANNSKPVIVQ